LSFKITKICKYHYFFFIILNNILSPTADTSMPIFFISTQRQRPRVFQLVFVPLSQYSAICSGLNNNQTTEGHPLEWRWSFQLRDTACTEESVL